MNISKIKCGSGIAEKIQSGPQWGEGGGTTIQRHAAILGLESMTNMTTKRSRK